MKINLLPKTEKELQRQEGIFKKLLLLFVFWLFCLFLFWASLYVLKIYVLSESKIVLAEETNKKELLQKEEFDNFSLQIQKTNQNLSMILAVFQEQFSIADLIYDLKGLSLDKVYFTSFSFEQSEADKEEEKDYLGKTQISGLALSREDLLTLKEALQEQAMFDKIYFLPYSWIKAKNADFTVNFFIKHEK